MSSHQRGTEIQFEDLPPRGIYTTCHDTWPYVRIINGLDRIFVKYYAREVDAIQDKSWSGHDQEWHAYVASAASGIVRDMGLRLLNDDKSELAL